MNYNVTSFIGFRNFYISIRSTLVSFLERLGFRLLSSGSSAMLASI